MNERTSRIGALIEAEAAAKAEAEAAKPCENCNGKAEKPKPRYEWHKSAFVRFFGTGCATCGSTGWLQRQIASTGRIVRFLNWGVGVFPRAWSMLRTVFSRKVDPGTYFTRMKQCYDAPCSVRFLRHGKKGIEETMHCGKCNCPRTGLASLRRKNRKSGWRCPAGIHAGSDREAAFREYVQVQSASADADRGGTDG